MRPQGVGSESQGPYERMSVTSIGPVTLRLHLGLPDVCSQQMSHLEPAAELLRRVGAVPAEDVIRYLVETCEALAVLGPAATVSLDSVSVSAAPGVKAQLTPRSFEPVPSDPGRAQVKAVAALGYELLKGMPPPAESSERDWLGERPELVSLLAPALAGTGASDVNVLAHQLRTLARPGTAAYAPPKVNDTVQSARTEPAQTEERAGEVLGAYELVRRLGSGGMGDVYLARHVRLGREVAVKILKPEFAAQADIVQRFFQEAKVVNEINHPHIVEIHDFVEEPGRGVYCVMDLLQGSSLADVLRQQGSLPVQRTAALFAQVCDALEAAHRRGVVHRDVKPDNIFVTTGPDGRDFVRVLDFGIARRLTPGHSRTEVGAVMGTPFYMAPEQAAGRPVDARADVYAVGVAMFEALTGAAPQDTARLLQTRKGEPVPDVMGALLQRCLSMDPAQRPASAAQVRDTLLAIAGAPVPPRPSTDAIAAAAGLGPGQSWRWLAVVGLLAAVGVGGVIFVSSGETHEPQRPRPPEPESTTPPPAPKLVVTKEPPLPELVEPAPPTSAGVNGAVKAAPPTPRGVTGTTKKAPSTSLGVNGQAPAANPWAARAETVQRRYDGLVSRFGATQLTSLEKAAVSQALDDFRADRQSALAESLASAEAALDAADRRLSR